MVLIAGKGDIKRQASEEAREAKPSQDVGTELRVFWIHHNCSLIDTGFPVTVVTSI